MKELIKKYREQIAYIFFGIVTTAVDWVAHFVLVNLGVSLFITGIFAWIIAVSVAFVTNRQWVFESQAKSTVAIFKEAIAFFASRGVLGILQIISIPLISHFLIDGVVFQTEGFDARMLVSVVIVVGNYFISKYWIFKEEKAV